MQNKHNFHAQFCFSLMVVRLLCHALPVFFQLLWVGSQEFPWLPSTKFVEGSWETWRSCTKLSIHNKLVSDFWFEVFDSNSVVAINKENDYLHLGFVLKKSFWYTIGLIRQGSKTFFYAYSIKVNFILYI